MNYQDIYNHVTHNNFYRHCSYSIGVEHETDDISEGILFALKNGDSIFKDQCNEAAKRFYNGDWGTFLDYDEENTPGHEWGEYPSIYGEIWIHREGEKTVLFFPFER